MSAALPLNPSARVGDLLLVTCYSCTCYLPGGSGGGGRSRGWTAPAPSVGRTANPSSYRRAGSNGQACPEHTIQHEFRRLTLPDIRHGPSDCPFLLPTCLPVRTSGRPPPHPVSAGRREHGTISLRSALALPTCMSGPVSNRSRRARITSPLVSRRQRGLPWDCQPSSRSARPFFTSPMPPPYMTWPPEYRGGA